MGWLFQKICKHRDHTGKNFLALHLRTLLRTFISEHPFETDNPLKLNPFVQKWKHSHVRLSSKQGRRTLTVQQQQSATLFTNCTNCCSKIERPAQIEDFLVCFFLFWMWRFVAFLSIIVSLISIFHAMIKEMVVIVRIVLQEFEDWSRGKFVLKVQLSTIKTRERKRILKTSLAEIN